MILNSRLILALDVLSRDRALHLATALKDRVDYVKVGYPLILAAGLDIVGEIARIALVIADLKIADIPNSNCLICEVVLDPRTGGIEHSLWGGIASSLCTAP